MSPDIEWHVGEESDRETIVKTTPRRPPRWRKPIVIIAAILGIGLGIAYAAIPEPPQPSVPTPGPTPIIRPTLQPTADVAHLDENRFSLEKTIDVEAQALADGDLKTFRSIQDPSNGRWFQAQIKSFQAWGKPLADFGPIAYLSRPLYTIVESSTLSPDQAWADIRQFRDGQYFRETRSYRQVNGQWLRTRPDPSLWSEQYQSFQTKHFEVTYPVEDSAFSQTVAHRFETAYDQVCTDLNCPNDLAMIQLTLSPFAEQPHYQLNTIILPSPHISGMFDAVDDETARLLDDPVAHVAYESLVSLLVQETSGSLAYMPADPTHGGTFFMSAIMDWESNRISSHPDVSKLIPPPELITNTLLVHLESLWDVQLTPSNPEQVAYSVILFIEQKFGAPSVGKFLKAIGPAHSLAQAIKASLGIDEAQFEQQWKDWLRQLLVQTSR